MEMQVREVGSVRILDLVGNLTIGREDLALRETFQGLLQKGGKQFVLNLGKVGYVDSSGLGEIVACKKRALEQDGDVRLLNPSAQVFEILQLSRLPEVFQIFRDEDKAVGSF